MPDDTQAQATPADAEAQAQEATDQPSTTQEVRAPSKPVESIESLPKWAQDLIRDLRKESATYRTAKQQRDQEVETTVAQLRTQLDDIAPKYADLETKYNTLRAELALSKAGAIDPDVLAPRLPADVLDDPDKLAKAIDQLRREKPHQFRAGSADGGARSSGVVDVQPGYQRLKHAYAESTNKR